MKIFGSDEYPLTMPLLDWADVVVGPPNKSSKLCTYQKRYIPKLTPHAHADLGRHLEPVPFCDVHDLLLLPNGIKK